ncbi:hypothetical protein SNN52_003794 [Cronobacter sakazakii]|uniref:hypothetical protein n=1 Tax=Cronobacter sakazakii TaxID=28141 RepID=UPI001375C030|nr:hypothetical protein [Cronobacter sakazakii]EGT5653780.1 hypothetical protein [Cronobacter sakazakii]EGT5751088.1 hypothetical protein [Cronobacter sakazakii]ELQ5981145.1 hypothetical protein [Cronobacter sakazakii]ELY2861548.1 hypothetical protein [Cronobacter sakazakii]ELY4225228.1 hypothetical protein [Cronobacter sakazakii]
MRLFLVLATFLVSQAAYAASDAEIVKFVEKEAKETFFPKDVKVNSLSEVKFYPNQEDSAYARMGNVCGKASVQNASKSAELVFIAPIVEKASRIHIETPTLYDLDSQGDMARRDLKIRCN